MSAVLNAPAASLRPMQPGDLAQVLAIERAAYPYPWSERIFRDCLRVGYCCWVVELGDSVEAYGIMSAGGNESHVLNLCVNPDSQRRGLGRLLLGHLLEVAREHRADVTLLEVRPSNHAARRLYEDMGFAEVGVRRRYYPARFGREDALILGRALVPGGFPAAP